MTMREPVVISDKGKVALSTRSRWHLVYDVSLWNNFTPDKFDAELKRICEEHEWIDVWSPQITPGSSRETSVKIAKGDWRIYRYRYKESEVSNNESLEIVSFHYYEDEYALDWPFYYRGDDDRLIKVMPNMPLYDEFWSYYDNGMFFTLDDVLLFWRDMYCRLTMQQVATQLDSISAQLDWKGQIARLIKRLMEAGNYSDAAEVACCASERALRCLYEDNAKDLFDDVAALLFALDKS